MTDTEAADQASIAPNGSDEEVSQLKHRIQELEGQVQKESEQATDYMKRWQYSQAELANMRRRTQQERDDLVKYGVAPLAGMLLEVLDNFERAEQALPDTLRSFTWISGVLLIHRQIDYLLQQHGIESIATSEQRYDPALHEAIANEPHDTLAEGVIIGEVQRGYRLHGRVLRPALVRVSRGPKPPASDETPPAAADTAPKGDSQESQASSDVRQQHG